MVGISTLKLLNAIRVFTPLGELVVKYLLAHPCLQKSRILEVREQGFLRYGNKSSRMKLHVWEGKTIGLMKHLINWQRMPRLELNRELTVSFMLHARARNGVFR